jgi:copper(I)-binding protein
MAVENNVMKMRRLDDGLEIKPGETVELKPGSFHLMMMGLDGGYVEGPKIPGTLIFEKAGTVEVEFAVQKYQKDEGGDDAGSAHKGH